MFAFYTTNLSDLDFVFLDSLKVTCDNGVRLLFHFPIATQVPCCCAQTPPVVQWHPLKEKQV